MTPDALRRCAERLADNHVRRGSPVHAALRDAIEAELRAVLEEQRQEIESLRALAAIRTGEGYKAALLQRLFAGVERAAWARSWTQLKAVRKVVFEMTGVQLSGRPSPTEPEREKP